MKPRHAAALALVGWYLMAPPVQEKDGVQYNAPIAKWDIQHVFDSAAECDVAMQRWRSRAKKVWDALNSKKPLPHNADLDLPLEQVNQMGACECIASDDPRLKEK
jgi:hypothetical protein